MYNGLPVYTAVERTFFCVISAAGIFYNTVNSSVILDTVIGMQCAELNFKYISSEMIFV